MFKLLLSDKEFSVIKTQDLNQELLATGDDFLVIVKEKDIYSIVLESSKLVEGFEREDGFSLITIDQEFGFVETGVIYSIIKPLAEAEISVLVISSFNKDHFLIKSEMLSKAINVFEKEGFAS